MHQLGAVIYFFLLFSFINAKVIPEPSATTSPPLVDVASGSEVDGEEGATVGGESKPPRYWQAILGDICQLPGFPRATGDPKRYLECVRQNLAEDRKDLGVWTLRECVEGFQFVAAARRCKNVRSIRRQEAICAGLKASEYDFCPAESADEFEIHETRAAPRRCACPDGQVDCLCARPEVLEPVKIARRTRTTQPAVLFADQQQAEEAAVQEDEGGKGMTPALRFQSFQTSGGPSRCQQRCGGGGTTTSACTCPTTIRITTRYQTAPFTQRPPPQRPPSAPNNPPPMQSFQQQPPNAQDEFNGGQRPPNQGGFNGQQSNGFNRPNGLANQQPNGQGNAQMNGPFGRSPNGSPNGFPNGQTTQQMGGPLGGQTKAPPNFQSNGEPNGFNSQSNGPANPNGFNGNGFQAGGPPNRPNFPPNDFDSNRPPANGQPNGFEGNRADFNGNQSSSDRNEQSPYGPQQSNGPPPWDSPNWSGPPVQQSGGPPRSDSDWPPNNPPNGPSSGWSNGPPNGQQQPLNQQFNGNAQQQQGPPFQSQGPRDQQQPPFDPNCREGWNDRPPQQQQQQWNNNRNEGFNGGPNGERSWGPNGDDRNFGPNSNANSQSGFSPNSPANSNWPPPNSNGRRPSGPQQQSGREFGDPNCDPPFRNENFRPAGFDGQQRGPPSNPDSNWNGPSSNQQRGPPAGGFNGDRPNGGGGNFDSNRFPPQSNGAPSNDWNDRRGGSPPSTDWNEWRGGPPNANDRLDWRLNERLGGQWEVERQTNDRQSNDRPFNNRGGDGRTPPDRGYSNGWNDGPNQQPSGDRWPPNSPEDRNRFPQNQRPPFPNDLPPGGQQPNGRPPANFEDPRSNGPPPSRPFEPQNSPPLGSALDSIDAKMRQMESVLDRQNQQLNRQQELIQEQRQVLQQERGANGGPPMPRPIPLGGSDAPSASSSNQAQCQMTTTQQQYCPRRDQQSVIQPQPCALVQGSAQNARYQGICSWMLDPLACDPESRCHFLQCQPAANNLFCGRWQRMPCAPATIFDPVAQVCVWDNAATPAPLPLPTPAPPSSTPQSPTGVQFGNPPAVIPTLSAAVGRPFGQNGGFNSNGASATSYGDAQSAFNNHNNFLGGGQAFGQQSNGFAGFPSDSNQNGGGFLQSTSFFPSAGGGFNGNSPYGPSGGMNGGMFGNQFGGSGSFGGASGPCCSTTQPQQNLCRGGVQIGSCSSTFQCPGQSVCQIGQFSNARPCFVCCHYKNMLMD